MFRQLALETFLGEINLLLALFKSGNKAYVKREEATISKAIEYLSQALQGLEQSRSKRIKTTLKKAIAAERAYHQVLVGTKPGEKIESVLKKHLQVLTKIAGDKIIDAGEIDNTIDFFKSIKAACFLPAAFLFGIFSDFL